MNYAPLTDGEIGSTLTRLRTREQVGFFTYGQESKEAVPPPRFTDWRTVEDLIRRCITFREVCAVISWLGPLKIEARSFTFPSWAKCRRACPWISAVVPTSDGKTTIWATVDAYNAQEWEAAMIDMALPVPGFKIDLGRVS